MVGLSDHLFAYGSLAGDLSATGARARLRGHRRVWGVAADNRESVAGYKRYRDRSDGSMPAAFVAFLDIVPDARAAVDGLLVPVTAGELAILDLRERNYDRVDVAAYVDIACEGPVWTYVGSAAGRARLREGIRSGTALIARDYAESVAAALEAIAPVGAAALPPHPGLEVADLERIDLPGGPGAAR